MNRQRSGGHIGAFSGSNNPDDIGVGLVHGDSANVDYFDGHAAGRSRPELRAAPMLNFQYFVDSAGNTIIM